jgi:YbbR domain-containing protein
MALRDFILDRFWLKLFSFILATLIWFTVESNQNETRVKFNPFSASEARTYTRTVRQVTHPMNRKLFKIDPLEVTITVRGHAAMLDRIELTDIQPYVILTDPVGTKAEYPVRIKDVPRNLQVESYSPQRVLVEPLPSE